MTDKDFDKRFKEKLDSLEPVQPSGAWDSFKKLMPVPWYILAFKKYGGWLFGGISTALLLFNTFNTEAEKHKIPLSSEIIKVDTVFQNIHTVDTVFQKVYLTKFIEKPLFVNNQTQVSEEKVIQDLAQISTSKENNLEEVVYQKNDDYQEETNTYREPKKPTKDTTLVNNLAKKVEDKKPGIFSKMSINPGVEMLYMGGSSFAYGVIGEIMLKNRFSITTGLSINNGNTEVFRKPQEFNRATGKVFAESVHSDGVMNYPGTSSVSTYSENVKDISIQTSRVRLPIYMSYYVPLTYNLDFVINTGTRLDLKVTETVSYVNEDNGVSPFRRFENRHKPAVFNNLFYGMGVQYRYGKLNGMLVPYFEFPFGKPNYIIKDNKFGINAALKFSLK